ncbi:MAG TPA: hypothetical protein VMB47_10845 [Candidatus Aquilonibacter sp.]|nr:hypothetical protein [Candidatus Aquilonibacter sp.]
MKRCLMIALLPALLAIPASAREHSYEKGKIVSMNSAPCGTAAKSSKTVAGELLGTDADHQNTQQVLCQEYVLQGEHILYHIRPEDTKHPALLPVGEVAEFRIDKDKIILRVPESDEQKEHSYTVISMTQHDADKTDALNSSN